jgi:glucose/arabinose dehydrogenase
MAEHGSWNRKIHVDYEVIRITKHNGAAERSNDDSLTGFVTPDGRDGSCCRSLNVPS